MKTVESVSDKNPTQFLSTTYQTARKQQGATSVRRLLIAKTPTEYGEEWTPTRRAMPSVIHVKPIGNQTSCIIDHQGRQHRDGRCRVLLGCNGHAMTKAGLWTGGEEFES